MSGSTAEKSDFVGGLHWHVPQPEPEVSEGFALYQAAKAGDPAALRRAAGIFEKFETQVRRRAARRKRAKANKLAKRKRVKRS